MNPSEPAEEVLYMTPGELSAILSISDIEISRLARRGILPRIPHATRSNSFMYPLVDCAREYIRHLKSAGQLDRDRYWKARAESEKQKAQKLATENGVRGGRLLDATEVETMQRELAHRLRQRLDIIPARIADQFGENGDRERIEEAVATEIGAALVAMSKFMTRNTETPEP